MNLKSIDLNLLVRFDALLSERNVSLAATRLGMTQSAMSHALRRLRVLFGDPLLRRGPRGMEPTDRALLLQPGVRDALADIHSIINTKTVFDPATARRTFKLSMSDAMSVETLPLIVRRLREQAAHIDVVVTSCGPRDASERIINNDIEMAIGVFPQLPGELLHRELYRDNLVCVADKKHPLLKRGRMDEKSYFSCPHVTVAPNLDPGIQLDDILTAMGLMRRIVVTVPHYLAVPALIRGTDLIANTRRRLVDVLGAASGLVVFPIPFRLQVPELSFRQIWHRRYDADAGHRWLRDLVMRAVRS